MTFLFFFGAETNVTINTKAKTLFCLKNTKSTSFTSDIKTSGSWWWDSYLPCVDGRNTTGEVDKEGLGLPAVEPWGPAYVDWLPGVRYHRQIVGSLWSIWRRVWNKSSQMGACKTIRHLVRPNSYFSLLPVYHLVTLHFTQWYSNSTCFINYLSAWLYYSKVY